MQIGFLSIINKGAFTHSLKLSWEIISHDALQAFYE
jgi:hypothetical protein